MRSALDLPFEFKPIADWVVIVPEEDPNLKGMMILLPSVDPQGVQRVWGRVIAKGEGAMTASGAFSPLEVEVGDLVWFASSPGVWHRTESGLRCVVQEQYIMLRVTEE